MGLALRIGPQDIREQLDQPPVGLKLSHDLSEKPFRNRPGMAEYTNRNLPAIPFRVRLITVAGKYVLNRQGKRDDGRFIVFPGPQVKVSVGFTLDFPASIK